jgi:catechol 2,3-dioxygenase-like lactoylglutathione lyase family enzyme
MAHEVRLTGIHHVTQVARDIKAMVRLLTEVVGICLVKATVSFDAQEKKTTTWAMISAAPEPS